MRRYRQTIDELLSSLTPLESTWRDAHASRVIELLEKISAKGPCGKKTLRTLFLGNVKPDKITKAHFDACITVSRLFLDLSKDEFTHLFRQQAGENTSLTRFRTEPSKYLDALASLGLVERMSEAIKTPVTWRDVLVERLKGGRGSAIRGQLRGRALEDFVERILVEVFGPDRYDSRCQFVGASGKEVEKADFAVPQKDDPAILIEVKAYGATGSKQTDVLGDVNRIIAQKRADTAFLLVTDGITWRDRVSDLRKLVERQNRGAITRIYTRSMAKQLRDDLAQLKSEHGI